jgi:hypothetical protein
MLTFTQATEFLSKGRKKTERNLNNNTVLHRVDDKTLAVRFWNTDVITIHKNGNYTLNSGGYRTVTTKERINEHSPARLYQSKGVWYVSSDTEFTDGMVIDSNGNVVKGGNKVQAKKYTKTVANIKTFIDGYAKDVLKNGLKQPELGDCLLCQFAQQNDNNPESHVLQHMKERYYVRTLLVTAIKSRNPGSVGIVWGVIEREAKEGKTKYLKMILRGYFKKITPLLAA